MANDHCVKRDLKNACIYILNIYEYVMFSKILVTRLNGILIESKLYHYYNLRLKISNLAIYYLFAIFNCECDCKL